MEKVKIYHLFVFSSLPNVFPFAKMKEREAEGEGEE